MNIDRYIEARQTTAIQKVSCGYLTVTLVAVEELNDAQIGYSVSEAGEDVNRIQ